MNLFEFAILAVIAGVCGSVGQKLAGETSKGCLVSVFLGFMLRCGFFRLFLLEILDQLIQLVFPEASVSLYPVGRIPHGPGVETTAAHSAVPFAAHQAGALQYSQVFGDGGPGNVERLGQLPHSSPAMD